MQYIYIRCQESSRNDSFVNVLRWGSDNRAEIFNIAKQMTATNQEVVGEKCKKNDEEVLAAGDQGKQLAWKEQYHRLLNEGLEWDKANLSVTYYHSWIPPSFLKKEFEFLKFPGKREFKKRGW